MEERKSLLGLDLAKPVGTGDPEAGPREAIAPAAGTAAAPQGAGGIRDRWRRRPAWVDHLLAAGTTLLAFALFFTGTGVTRAALPLDRMKTDPHAPIPLEKGEAKKIRAGLPDRPYLAIDRANNIMWLRQGDGTLLRRMVVSAGSGGVLKEPNGKRTWVFDTPLGVFTIKGKQDDPVWVKPDWAFIEEGEPIPKNYSERFEPGMLGEYAMSLGGGYLIHGTLYERLLGRNVTHGCIRVGRDDLRVVVKTVRVGDRVYIF